MPDVLTQYHHYADGLLRQLSAPNRIKLAKAIAKKLREHNRNRITAQIAPDGTAFKPRKQLRKKKGKMRRKMFTKLRTAKYLKINADSNSATVYFTNKVYHIAKVHHFGLRDKVNRKQNFQIVYPERPLLGINEMDLQRIEDIILAHLRHLN